MENQFDQLWKKFLDKLEIEISNSSQADVARRLGVNRGQVSKWLSGLQVGGNLKTFMSHLEKLNTSIESLLDLQEPQTSQYDKAIAATLRSTANIMGLSYPVIAKVAQIQPSETAHYLDGIRPIPLEHFNDLCKAIGVSPDRALERAKELSTPKESMQFKNSA